MSWTKVAKATESWTDVPKPGTMISGSLFDTALFDTSRFDVTSSYLVDLWVRVARNQGTYTKSANPSSSATKVAKNVTTWTKGAL